MYNIFNLYHYFSPIWIILSNYIYYSFFIFFVKQTHIKNVQHQFPKESSPKKTLNRNRPSTPYFSSMTFLSVFTFAPIRMPDNSGIWTCLKKFSVGISPRYNCCRWMTCQLLLPSPIVF